MKSKKVLGLAVGLALGLSPVFVGATTTVAQATSSSSDVQAQIQNLLNQITNLRVQLIQLLSQQVRNLGGTATSTEETLSSSCFRFGRDLSRGDNGDDVRELQRKLAKDSTIFPEGLVTGFFGHNTEEAVKRFQHKFNIASTTNGFFGPRSRKFFHEHCDKIHDEDDDDSTTASSTLEREDSHRGSDRGDREDTNDN